MDARGACVLDYNLYTGNVTVADGNYTYSTVYTMLRCKEIVNFTKYLSI